MNHLVSYDISDNRLRLRIANMLKQSGCLRLQYSVFAGNLRESVSYTLLQNLTALTKEPEWSDEDSVFILPLHQYSRDKLTILGNLPPDWDLMQGDLHTLVL